MSAWYLLNAMGIYPVCPGDPRYSLGRPSFDRVELQVKDDRVFTIVAEDRSADHPFVQALLSSLDEPLLSSSLILPDPAEEILDSEDLYDEVYGQVDLFVDAGYCPLEPTTLLDLTGEAPQVLRLGQGVVDFL